MDAPHSKRSPPFSLRLTQKERALLEKRANGTPLGTFIRATLFGVGEKAPVDNQQALPQILGKLGGSGMAGDVNEIARLARLGALPITPETEAEIHQATTDIADMKAMLMKALHIKER